MANQPILDDDLPENVRRRLLLAMRVQEENERWMQKVKEAVKKENSTTHNPIISEEKNYKPLKDHLLFETKNRKKEVEIEKGIFETLKNQTKYLKEIANNTSYKYQRKNYNYLYDKLRILLRNFTNEIKNTIDQKGGFGSDGTLGDFDFYGSRENKSGEKRKTNPKSRTRGGGKIKKILGAALEALGLGGILGGKLGFPKKGEDLDNLPTDKDVLPEDLNTNSREKIKISKEETGLDAKEAKPKTLESTNTGSGKSSLAKILGRYGKPLGLVATAVSVAPEIKETIETVQDESKTAEEKSAQIGKVSGGVAGGVGGTVLGGNVGAMIGGGVGALFGGVGAIPGAMVGGVLGSVIGGWFGAEGGEIVGEALGSSLGKILNKDKGILEGNVVSGIAKERLPDGTLKDIEVAKENLNPQYALPQIPTPQQAGTVPVIPEQQIDQILKPNLIEESRNRNDFIPIKTREQVNKEKEKEKEKEKQLEAYPIEQEKTSSNFESNRSPREDAASDSQTYMIKTREFVELEKKLNADKNKKIIASDVEKRGEMLPIKYREDISAKEKEISELNISAERVILESKEGLSFSEVIKNSEILNPKQDFLTIPYPPAASTTEAKAPDNLDTSNIRTAQSKNFISTDKSIVYSENIIKNSESFLPIQRIDTGRRVATRFPVAPTLTTSVPDFGFDADYLDSFTEKDFTGSKPLMKDSLTSKISSLFSSKPSQDQNNSSAISEFEKPADTKKKSNPSKTARAPSSSVRMIVSKAQGPSVINTEIKDKVSKIPDYLKSLAVVESSSNYKEENGNYLGAYQFGKQALQQLGYLDKQGNWTGKDNIKSKEDFLDNPQIQDRAALEFARQNWKTINQYPITFDTNNKPVYAKDMIGKEINGMKITESGLLAAAHLGGAGSVVRFLKSGGSHVAVDSNNIPITQYMSVFGGKDVSSIPGMTSTISQDVGNFIPEANAMFFSAGSGKPIKYSSKGLTSVSPYTEPKSEEPAIPAYPNPPQKEFQRFRAVEQPSSADIAKLESTIRETVIKEASSQNIIPVSVSNKDTGVNFNNVPVFSNDLGLIIINSGVL